MKPLTDDRLGQVLSRRDHIGALPEANPVLSLFLGELAEMRARYVEEVFEAGSMLLDLLGMNELGAPRVKLHTAMRVLGDIERDAGRGAYAYLAEVGNEDKLLGLALEALIAYSDRSHRPRGKTERDAVAFTVYVLLRAVREEVEVREFERAFAG